MGFEIIYHFYPKKENGVGYEVDNPQTFTKQIGKMEDVPVEKLANAIMMQLARRDLMVYDVEVFEFTKRKVGFKETKGGVLIKNKKFLLDGTVEAVEEEPQQVQVVATSLPQQVIYDKPSSQPIRWEVYDPDGPIIQMLAKRFNLTPKKKYPIFEEKTVIQRINVNGSMTEMPGYEYTTADDAGNKVKVPALHFTPELKGLIGMVNNSVNERDHANMPRLMHMEQYNDINMPVLRR
jgi:hypothetical protein